MESHSIWQIIKSSTWLDEFFFLYWHKSPIAWKLLIWHGLSKFQTKTIELPNISFPIISTKPNKFSNNNNSSKWKKTQSACKAKDMKRKQNKQPKSKAPSKLKIHVKKSERKKSESHFSIFSARFDFVCCTRECCWIGLVLTFTETMFGCCYYCQATTPWT